MSISEFVAMVKAGDVMTSAGDTKVTKRSVKMVERVEKLRYDAESICSELFNRGILDAKRITWDDALAKVKEAMGGKV